MFSLWVILFLIPSVFASWETHEGVTSWKVQVTDDLRACGESAKTKVYTFSITHNQKVARIADPVHGMASGTFEGDVLHVVSRTIPDGSGSSKLSAFDVIFTCTAIQAKYRWDYKDSQMSCSGTTEWRGTRSDGTACPGTITPQPDLAKEITEIRSEEDKLKAALAKDPKNFWANWDMAELKKNPAKDVVLKSGDLVIVPEKNSLKDKIFNGKVVPWATFFISMGLVLALLI